MKIASTSGYRASSSRAAMVPDAIVKSPCTTASSDIPAARMALRQPVSRSMPADMSAGPAIVAMRVQPRSMRCCVASRPPSTLSVSTYWTSRSSADSGRPTNTFGTRDSCSARSSSSLRVVRDDDRAVDVPVAQVADGALALAGAGDDEHHLHVGVGERRAQAVERAREERVRQDALVGLGHHEGDRVGALGDQRAGGAVRGVAEVGDRGLDRGERLGRHAQTAVDGAGGCRARDTGALGDLLERRRGGPRGVHVDRDVVDHRWSSLLWLPRQR